MKKIKFFLWFLIIFFFLSFLPLVPVSTAPVVPDPYSAFGWASLQTLFGVGMLAAGISYRLFWYSWLVLIAVVVLAFWISKKYRPQIFS